MWILRGSSDTVESASTMVSVNSGRLGAFRRSQEESRGRASIQFAPLCLIYRARSLCAIWLIRARISYIESREVSRTIDVMNKHSRRFEALMNALNYPSCEDKQALPKFYTLLYNVDSVTKVNASRSGLISKWGQMLLALCFTPRKEQKQVYR